MTETIFFWSPLESAEIRLSSRRIPGISRIIITVFGLCIMGKKHCSCTSFLFNRHEGEVLLLLAACCLLLLLLLLLLPPPPPPPLTTESPLRTGAMGVRICRQLQLHVSVAAQVAALFADSAGVLKPASHH